MSRTFEFQAPLWLFSGNGAWHFITVPPDVSDEIADLAPPRPGFGSVRVQVRIGTTSWATSVFPSKEAGGYLLPVKKQVRAAEQLTAGDQVAVMLTPDL